MDNSQQAISVYEQIAVDYATKFSSPSDYIDQFLEQVQDEGEILDIGCGPGIDSGYMTSKGFKVIGVDLSKKMLELARQKFPDIEFQYGDMREIQFKEDRFDGIFASYCLIHIPKIDLPELMLKFNRILKVGGVIYIGLQSGESEEVFINQPFKPDEKIFINVFSKSEIQELLVESGFSIILQYERKPRNDKELNYTKLYIVAKKTQTLS